LTVHEFLRSDAQLCLRWQRPFTRAASTQWYL
jgi:hypothetical protein